MEIAFEVANDGAVRAIRGVGEGHAHFFAGEAIGEVGVDDEVRVLIVWVVVVEVELAINEFSGGAHAGLRWGDSAMKDPVDHVAALPAGVAAAGFLKSSGSDKEMRVLGAHEGDVEAFQFGGLERGRILAGLVAAEEPVVVRPHAESDGGVAEFVWTDLADGFPVEPSSRLRKGEILSGLLFFEGLEIAAEDCLCGGGGGEAVFDFEIGLSRGGFLPFVLGIDRPGDVCFSQ